MCHETRALIFRLPGLIIIHTWQPFRRRARGGGSTGKLAPRRIIGRCNDMPFRDYSGCTHAYMRSVCVHCISRFPVRFTMHSRLAPARFTRPGRINAPECTCTKPALLHRNNNNLLANRSSWSETCVWLRRRCVLRPRNLRISGRRIEKPRKNKDPEARRRGGGEAVKDKKRGSSDAREWHA